MIIKNKEGYTLIEIIVCIILLTVVTSLVLFLINNKTNKQKELDKIISTVKNSADVYYSLNQQEFKNKISDNYGYLVLDVKSLRDEGLLKDEILYNNKDITKYENSYEKIVIIDHGNTSNVDLTQNDNNNFVDYIYPYQTSSELFIKPKEIIILESEINNFKCNSLIEDLDYGIWYINKDYKVTSLNNSSCKQLKDNDKELKENELLPLALKIGSNTLLYNINSDSDFTSKNSLKSFINVIPRNVKVEKTPILIAYTQLKDEKAKYSCGDWTNSDVLLCFGNDFSCTSLSGTFEWKENSTLNDESYKAIQSEIVSGIFNYNSLLSNVPKSISGQCEVKVDKISPVITMEKIGNNIKFSATDNDSGVKIIFQNDKILNNSDILAQNTVRINFSIPVPEQSYKTYLYAVDNAGNITRQEFQIDGKDKFPTIIYEPVPDSFSKFKLTINAPYKLKKDSSGTYKIDIQKTFDDSYYSFSKSYSDNGKWFNDNYSYDQNYSKEKDNYIYYENYISTNNCSETKCEIILDLMDVINKDLFRYSTSQSYRFLNNFNTYFHIKVVDDNNNEKEIKINVVLNVNIGGLNNYYYSSSTACSSTLRGIDSLGNILYSNYCHDATGKSNNIYLYKSSTNETIKIINSYAKSLYFYSFDKTNINYCLSTYHEKFNGIKAYYSTSNHSYNYITNQDSFTNINALCPRNSVVYFGDKYISDIYDDSKYGNFITNLLKTQNSFERDKMANPNTYSLNNDLRIFYSQVNDKKYRGLFINHYHYTTNTNTNLIKFLTFIPEVSLTEIS